MPRIASRWRDPLVLLILLLGGLTLIRMAVAGGSLLSGDEAYYWLWSRRLQLSYFDHPGMMAWAMAAVTAVAGPSELGIRLSSILAAAVTSLLAFDAARVLYANARMGLRAVLWINVTLLFSAGAVTATPDAPLLVFWTAALWATIRLFTEERARWLYVLGAVLGLGFCSKYTMVLIAPGILSVFLLFPAGRRWWRSPHLYLAVLLALACTSPVLVWNMQHDWVSFRKQLAHSFDTPVSNPLKSLGTYLATQLGVVTPLILGFALAGMAWALWAGWRRKRPELFLLGATSFPVLAFFVRHSLSGLVQPHWSGPAYLGGLLALAGALGDWNHRRWVRGLALAAPILGGVLAAAAYLQMATGLLPIPPRMDTLSRLGGWDELAGAVEGVRRDHPGIFVFVEKHELSGLLSYYLPDHPPVFLTGSTGIPRIPSYDASDVEDLKGRDGLLVIKAGSHGVIDASKYFDAFTKVGRLERHWGGRRIDRYELWLGRTYRQGSFLEFDDVPKRWKK